MNMNILHLSPYFPSLDANHAGGICMGKQIETLRTWHQVYVLTFEASRFDRKLIKAYAGDERYKSVKINALSRIIHIMLEPWMPNYFAARSSLRFSIKLIYMIKKYKIDVIHAEYASMGQYVWIKSLFPYLKFNLIEHDMTAQSYERKISNTKGIRKLYMNYQLSRVLRMEGKYCKLADSLFTFNEKDKLLLELKYGRKDCFILNPYYGVDEAFLLQDTVQVDREYANICFLGQMGRDENYLAAIRLIKIAEKVKKQIPELQVYIVGNQPPEQLKKRENEYIHVTGFVEDVDWYLKRAQLSVFPLELGAGIKLKVLRSLAVGTPVITGSVGAEGIDEEGEVIILAETDNQFVESILLFINDFSQCNKVSQLSKRYVMEHFSWKQSEQVLLGIYYN